MKFFVVSCLFLGASLQAARSIHTENTKAIDRESESIENLKKDFAAGHFKKYCPDVRPAMPLNCFARYLELRGDKKALSVVEVPVLTEVAGIATINRDPTSQKSRPEIDRIEDAVNFLSLLSGIHALSLKPRTLVPPKKTAKNPAELRNIDQLTSIEEDLAQKLSLHLKDKLNELTVGSMEKLQKLPVSDRRQILEKRLQEIQKSTAL